METTNEQTTAPAADPVPAAGPLPVQAAGLVSELSWPMRVTLASASAGAAAIHLAMVPAHAAEWLPLGIAFALAGWFQLVFATAVIARPTRRWLQLNVLASTVFVASWAVTRTIGLPVGPEAGSVEAVSVLDGLCVALEVLGAGLAGLGLARPRVGDRWPVPAFVLAAVVPALAVVSLTTAALASPAGAHDHGHEDAGHDHVASADAGHDHTAADTTAMDHDHAATDHNHAAMDHDHAAMDHDHAAMDHDHAAMDHDHDGGVGASDPLVAGASDGAAGGAHDHGTVDDPTIEHKGSDGHTHLDCTAPVTPEQQAGADDLVARTTAAVARYDDVATAVAAGYVPITPPNAPIVHYGNIAYMTDGRILDPDRVESLMYAFDQQKHPYFIGAMYLNDTPTVAPPTPGGCLTMWHDHTNLCIAPGKGMVGVVKPDGSCPAGSSNETTSQMIHVWTIPLSSGPLSHEAAPAEVRAALLQQKLGA